MLLAGDDLFTFSTLLRTLRKRRRLTQQQLADAVGVHRSAIVRWEQGTSLPESKALVLDLARHLHLNHQETRQLLEASLTALAPPWSVPLLRNPYFTGRDEVLRTLHAQLGTNQTVALTQTSALHGLGGVGKTQIALEYAYRHALEYSAVFWIGAETEEQIVSSLLRAAAVLGVPGRDDLDQQRVVAAVQHWLSTHSQWLLIWDNVENLDMLQRFLPATRSGAMLLTTRCQVLGTLAHSLELSPMEQREGILFLLRRAKVLPADASGEHVQFLAEQTPARYTAAAALVDGMGGLPLALDQAGAYLEATRCGLPAYLDLFHTRRAPLLWLRGEGVRDHPASVATTFTLMFLATAGRHPSVRDLLRVCALLQPDAIPEELFLRGAQPLGGTLEAVCRDPLAWNRVVATACASSLLSRQPEEQTLSLHRLVQAVLLDGMSEAEQEQWNRRVTEALEASFPEIRPATEYAIWKQGERLLPHALLCLHRVAARENSLPLASLAYKAAQYLRERSRYGEAEVLYQQALRIREQLLGPEHPEIATLLNYLAAIYYEQSKYAEAERLLQRVLRIREQALGPEHPSVANALNALGMISAILARYAEAERLLRRNMRIREQTQGPDHPHTAAALDNLADLLRDQGRYAEVEPLYRRALHIWEQALGPEHPDVALALNDLADLFRAQGRYLEAEQLYHQALHIWEQALGPERLILARALHGLADLSRNRGQDQEAESLYLRTLALREQHLDSRHPETAETLYGLALLRRTQSRLDVALSLAERALHMRVQSLGEAHPKTSAARELSACLVQEQACARIRAASERSPEALADPCNHDQCRHGVLPSLSNAVVATSCEDDPLQAFLDACCEQHPRAWCRSGDLWQAYERWVRQQQQRYPLSRRAFLAQLKTHGCRADRTNSQRIWRGITLVNRGTVTEGDGE